MLTKDRDVYRELVQNLTIPEENRVHSLGKIWRINPQSTFARKQTPRSRQDQNRYLIRTPNWNRSVSVGKHRSATSKSSWRNGTLKSNKAAFRINLYKNSWMRMETPALRLADKSESWSLVANNIALKDGDYPGTKNVSRMRSAIIEQHSFLKQHE